MDLVDKLMKKGDGHEVVQMMFKANENASKSYFYSTLIGYLIAIITTVVIMIVFDHGQPALLYLVPGVLLAVLLTAAVKGELKQVYEWNEEKLIGVEEAKDK